MLTRQRRILRVESRPTPAYRFREMQTKGDMKVLGRRTEPRATRENMEAIQKLLLDLRGQRLFLPKGVYRFKSHEEADAWQMKMLTRPNPESR